MTTPVRIRLGADGVATFVLGQSPPSSVYNQDRRGVPFYQGKADFGPIHPVPRVWTDAGQQFAEPADVLISMRAPVGDVNLADSKCAIGRGLAAIRAGSNVDPLYLFFALKHVKPVLEQLSTGSTFASINKNTLADLELPLPTPEEQERIAAALYWILQSFLRERSLVGITSALKATSMAYLFTRGLRAEAQKELRFEVVPASWRELPLEEVAVVQTGAAKGRKLESSETIEVPYLRVANVQDGHLDLREMKLLRIKKTEVERYRLRSNDVVLTEGGDFDKLGRGFIWRDELPLCIHQNHVFAVRTNVDQLLPEYFAYLAQSPYGKAYFLNVAHKTTNLACINSNKLKAFPVVLPDLGEQREIAEILSAIDRKIDIHAKKADTFEALFRALLHRLMTGEIRVSDLDVSVLSGAPQETLA